MSQRIIRQLVPIFLILILGFLITLFFIDRIQLCFNLLTCLVLGVIFLGSTILVNYRIEKTPKRFVSNFLVMTTLQLLAFLSYEVILIVQGERFWVTIHALVICNLLIVVQSINLSRLNLNFSEEDIEQV